MSGVVNIGALPTFWIVRRPGRQWCASDMEKIAKLFREDGFRIVAREIWPLSRGDSEMIVSHSAEGAASLFVLKYGDKLRENQLTLKQYEHNVKKSGEWIYF